MMISADCMACVVKNQMARVQGYDVSERQKSEFMLDVMRAIHTHSGAMSVQRIIDLIDDMHAERFGFVDDKAEFKRTYNGKMLHLLARIRQIIEAAPDPLLSAICHAQAGNYIDLNTVDVRDDELLQILENAAQSGLDQRLYGRFAQELDGAKSLAYLCDNAGEIALDRLLIEQLIKRCPDMRITAIVRGAPVTNDATLDDARQVGLTGITCVIGNGTRLAGTELNAISDEARSVIESADIIVSKGQGNFETMAGCGLNVYYLFLCKCDWFVRRFKMARNAPMFVHEREVKVSPFVD